MLFYKVEGAIKNFFEVEDAIKQRREFAKEIIFKSAGFMSKSTSSASGRTATVAAEV